MKRNARVLNYICCGGIVFAASNFYVLCQGMAATVLLLAVYFMVNIMPVFGKCAGLEDHFGKHADCHCA